MRIITFLCLSLIASLQLIQANPSLVGNASPLDFSSLNTDNSTTEFMIRPENIQALVSGDLEMIISDLKWQDARMADYQTLHGNNPQRIILAAFNNKAGEDSPKLADLDDEALASIYSTRDGSRLLYLYIGETTSYPESQAIASFLMIDAQAWFEEQGLIAIPDIIYQQNLVTLGLKEPKFPGGYK